MGTSATIAVVKSDGAVIQTSVHYDGYLSGVGKILLEEYTFQDRVELLVSLGEMSSLGKFITPYIYLPTSYPPEIYLEYAQPFPHSYEHPLKDVTVYYGRDRGETGTEPEEYGSVYHFYEDFSPEEFNYLFVGGKWIYCCGSGMNWIELTQEAIAEEE